MFKMFKDRQKEITPLPSPELTWLYTHCRAIGMTCKSDSGKWEHDIALFTSQLQERIKELESAAIYEQAYHDHINDRNHTAFGTRDYSVNPVRSFYYYLDIRKQEVKSQQKLTE